MKTFDVRVHREDGFWVAVVRGVRGGATEVRRLANLEPEVRDLLSGLLDLYPDEIDLNMHQEAALSPGAAKALAAYHQAADDLEHARLRYEAAQHNAVAELRADDVSVRDAGTLLGLSFQRIQQLSAA